MKKILVMMTALLMGIGVQAQNWRDAPKVILGVRGGFSAGNVTDSHGATDDLFGLTGGFSASFRIAVIPFYVETGLYYENMGYKVHDEKYSDNSLVVPAMISYHAYVKKDMTIQPFIGPSIIYSGEADELDLGLRVGCGFSYKQFYAGLGVDLNLSKDNGDYDYCWDEHYWSYDDNFNGAAFVTVGVNF